MKRFRIAVPAAFGSSHRFGLFKIMAVASVFLMTACDIKYRVFAPVDPAPLEGQLELGKSNRTDVRAAFGEPTGSGRSMLPLDIKARTLWSYFYEEGSLETMGRTMMLVYFDGDELAGYLWFSSLPPHAAAPSR